MQKHKLWLWLGLITVAVVGIIYWLIPHSPPSSGHAQAATARTSATSSLAVSSLNSPRTTLPFLSPSQQDTEINCQLQLDSGNRLMVNEQTRNCFEYFITQYGEKSLEQIRQDFQRYIAQIHQEPALGQILDLWQRYLDYRERLGELQPPQLDPDSPQYYRSIFNSMKNLRQQFFSAYEIEGLFGVEDVYHDYTLERLSVMDNKQLSEAEKAQKLKALFEQLPEDWQANLEQLNKLEDLRALTAEIKARGGSSAELRQMRLNLVGPEATQRLEQLDVERSHWKTRVTQYLNERDQILSAGLNDAAKQQAVAELRQQYFNNPQEQLRLDTFESVHDQGGKLPFAE
ncbi:lipase secretion chaperone [Acinetobacter indicus]|uniref:lipase secretion chaperone n=1 Tax=Acinetobacter indicus TaxID=756892 RepID=UPI00209AA762|nr:lipase secretion chaperone [Acinetobacter indicus]MCO8098602.1 lipase secretion chaperone [Acinetobacter indicus]MCO8104205.1 lipase secretion chaperone [Acinetobacter indicus]MCO8109880.1 lipase secretion chaperone [Acinetobacter indicus]